MKIKKWLSALMAVALLGFAACSDDDDSSGNTTVIRDENDDGTQTEQGQKTSEQEENTPDAPALYTVTVADIANGTVTATPTTAANADGFCKRLLRIRLAHGKRRAEFRCGDHHSYGRHVVHIHHARKRRDGKRNVQLSCRCDRTFCNHA